MKEKTFKRDKQRGVMRCVIAMLIIHCIDGAVFGIQNKTFLIIPLLILIVGAVICIALPPDFNYTITIEEEHVSVLENGKWECMKRDNVKTKKSAKKIIMSNAFEQSISIYYDKQVLEFLTKNLERRGCSERTEVVSSKVAV